MTDGYKNSKFLAIYNNKTVLMSKHIWFEGIIIEKTGSMDKILSIKTFDDAYQLVLMYGKNIYITEKKRKEQANYLCSISKYLNNLNTRKVDKTKKS